MWSAKNIYAEDNINIIRGDPKDRTSDVPIKEPGLGTYSNTSHDPSNDPTYATSNEPIYVPIIILLTLKSQCNSQYQAMHQSVRQHSYHHKYQHDTPISSTATITGYGIKFKL